MGFWSIAYSIGAQTVSNVQKMFRNPLDQAKKKIVRKALKSETVNQLHNTVIRFLASELLLCVVVCLASAATYKENMPVYNYVLPCVVSALCTEFMRRPLNDLCDDYTQPVADKVQAIVVKNWDNEGFWMSIKHGTGISLGAVAIGLSSINDVTYTTIFVTQTLLTSFVVGLMKNKRHPLRRCCRRRLQDYRDRPVATLLDGPVLDDQAFDFQEDSDDELVVRHNHLRHAFESDSVERITQKVRQKRRQQEKAEEMTRIIHIESETELNRLVAINMQQEEKGKQEEHTEEFIQSDEDEDEEDDKEQGLFYDQHVFPSLINEGHFVANQKDSKIKDTLSDSMMDSGSEEFYVIPLSQSLQ